MDLRSYMNQGDVWVQRPDESGDREPVKISEMSLEHRRKAARWLMAKAPGIIMIVEAQVNENVLDGTQELRDVLTLIAQDPRGWLRETTLFRALVEDLPTKVVKDI